MPDSTPNLTGFIVTVKTKSQQPLSYKYENKSKVLPPDESFIGYFFQQTERLPNDQWAYLHFQKIRQESPGSAHYHTEGDAVFSTSDILVEVLALRGPASNNTKLATKFRNLPLWHEITHK